MGEIWAPEIGHHFSLISKLVGRWTYRILEARRGDPRKPDQRDFWKVDRRFVAVAGKMKVQDGTRSILEVVDVVPDPKTNKRLEPRFCGRG